MADYEDDVVHMMNDTSRLFALRTAGNLSSLALSAQQSNALADNVEFWKWLARNYSPSGIFESSSSMLEYISQGATKEDWVRHIVQGKGYEWDWMTQQRGSVRNILQTFDAGDVANRVGSDVTKRNILTGESTEYQMKAYTSKNAPNLHNTSKDVMVVTNSEKAGIVQRKGYEVETRQSANEIAASTDKRMKQIRSGQAETSYTLSSTAGMMAKAGLVGCAVGITVEALASYRAWKNGTLSDSEYFTEILKAGGNAGFTAAGTAGIMLPVSAAMTAAGASTLITIPVAFVVGEMVNKIVAPCFGLGKYREILSRAKYYQNIETLYNDLVSGMERAAGHYLEFMQGMKKQHVFHEQAKRESMKLNKNLKAIYDSI